MAGTPEVNIYTGGANRSLKRFLLLLATAIAVGAGLVSCSLNIYFVKKIKILNEELAATATDTLRPGQIVPPLEVFTSDGTDTRIRYDGGGTEGTVLYVFRMSCRWCTWNKSKIQFLSENIRRRYRVLGISLDENVDNQKLAVSNGLKFPVYLVSKQSARAYSFGSTPETMVISQEGVIQQLWEGAFTGPIKDRVEGFFGIRLPNDNVDR